MGKCLIFCLGFNTFINMLRVKTAHNVEETLQITTGQRGQCHARKQY